MTILVCVHTTTKVENATAIKHHTLILFSGNDNVDEEAVPDSCSSRGNNFQLKFFISFINL